MKSTQATKMQKYIFLMKRRDIFFSFFFNRLEKRIFGKKNPGLFGPGFCMMIISEKLAGNREFLGCCAIFGVDSHRINTIGKTRGVD